MSLMSDFFFLAAAAIAAATAAAPLPNIVQGAPNVFVFAPGPRAQHIVLRPQQAAPRAAVPAAAPQRRSGQGRAPVPVVNVVRPTAQPQVAPRR